ncbi:alpha/beta fold hydrolase [Amycolatopsis sp. CA-230715]|uniref:alpha/beta fold hydrolase n=1 Tax=Amycolatopsis sp. CA-230715 TaxID=2745196 RepID=UPI001C0299A4|nr:alpha/beta hydrolase [Amycolatopsis sp. CA-230715]QWF80621.1 Aclacinomycin methylesterase RdmC [Amycolatopsis sp. CA-230715]
MGEERASNVGPSGIEIAYERFGDPQAPPVLLIQGIAAQMIHWHEEFCAALAARGLQVIRFDNRDNGRSTHLTGVPVPDLPAVQAGDLSTVSYTLSDLAADTVGLLDALGIGSAHLVGLSLGGYIAQTVAIEHPARIRSLVPISSTTGDLSVGQPKPETLKALFGGPPAETRDEVIEQRVNAARVVGSPVFAFDEADVRARATRAYDRGHDPLGVARGAVASVASGDRTESLRSVDVPTLVIHGDADPMCDVSGGKAIAAAVPGAELMIVEGMGHGLPRELWPELIERISTFVRRVDG